MRILWHGPAPWMATGYGQQCGLWARLLAAAGHEVTISAFAGLQGREMDWHGIRVLPGSREAHGNDFLGVRAAMWLAQGPGLILIFCDTWTINPRVIAGAPVVMLTPVDCGPRAGAQDVAVLRQSGAAAAAISRHGQRALAAAGLQDVAYMPNGIDTTLFAPGDREAARRLLGMPRQAFIIGINAANVDSTPSRKALPQQLAAFAAFAKTHSDALLALHTRADGPDGAVHLHDLCAELGIGDRVMFCDQIRYWEGGFPPEYLALFYNAIDVLSLTSFGEGFGLPLIEAQACGTPVITSRHSAMTELAGPGWLVAGEPWWQNDHLSWWHYPLVSHIRRAYAKAHDQAGRRREQARAFALGYRAETLLERYWQPALAQLAERVTTSSGDSVTVGDVCEVSGG